MDFINLFAVFLVGIVAGFLGGLTSGGGNLLSIPFLIFLGLPVQIAIATDRFGSFGYVVSTIHKFSQSKKIVYTFMVPLIILSIIGAFIGSNIVINVDKHTLQKLIGIIIVILLPLIIWKKDLGVKKARTKSTAILIIGFFLYFLTAIYDGFLGAAGGILVAYLFVFVFGLTFTQANATEKIPYAFNAIISIIIFAISGIIHYQLGLALLAGELLGAYGGAHVAIKKGDRLVRIVLIGVVLISSVKLLLFS